MEGRRTAASTGLPKLQRDRAIALQSGVSEIHGFGLKHERTEIRPEEAPQNLWDLTLNKANLHLSPALCLLSLKAYAAKYQRDYCGFCLGTPKLFYSTDITYISSKSAILCKPQLEPPFGKHPRERC